MPIYEFRCGQCGAVFEELTGTGSVEAACPECGSVQVERLYSPPGRLARLVKTPRESRRQEARNAQLRARTKARFKEARARGRARGTGGGG